MDRHEALDALLDALAERVAYGRGSSGDPLYGGPGRFGDKSKVDPLSLGVMNSGNCTLVAEDGAVGQAIKIALPQRMVNPGFSVVHISCVDVETTVPPPVTPNQRVLADIEWGGARSGEAKATIDISQGAKFTVAGAAGIIVKPRMVAQDLGAFVAGRNKLISATVQWGTGISAIPAIMTSFRVPLVANVASARFDIPPQARSAIAMSDTATTTTLKGFSAVDAGGGAVVLAQAAFTNATLQNARMPLGMGIDSWTLTAAADSKAYVLFELWL